MFKTVLQKLLEISDSNQTDLAYELGYSPSTLSKHLNGEPIKSATSLKNLASKSAIYFSRKLTEANAYHRLMEIFPITLNFNSEQEVEEYLTICLEYYMVNYVYDQEPLNIFRSRRFALYGLKELTYYLSVFISDLLLNGDSEVDFYIQYPITTSDTFIFGENIVFNSSLITNRINFNISITDEFFDKNSDIFNTSTLIRNLLDAGNVKMHYADDKIRSSYVMIPNGFYLDISVMPNGTIVATNVDDYLLMTSTTKSIVDDLEDKIICYDLENINLMFKGQTELVKSYSDKIHHIFTYLPVSIVMNDNDFIQSGIQIDNLSVIRDFFKGMFKDNLNFYMSRDLLRYIELYKTMYVPFIGELPISPDISTRREKKENNNYGFMSDTYKSQFIAVSDDLVFIYAKANKYNESKVFIFDIGKEKVKHFLQNTLKSDKIYTLNEDVYFGLLAKSIYKKKK